MRTDLEPFFKQALDCNILRKVKSMERAQRILKKFSKILKEQGAGPLFTTFKGYVPDSSTIRVTISLKPS